MIVFFEYMQGKESTQLKLYLKVFIFAIKETGKFGSIS